ncbi:hypothetical protein NP493_109g07042 [Ridgeia piscesae]|uniref:Uncharacterized protein n=1 Tax=Ridgeia piscesae TaxID=27915 RepID=A0AAD9UH52_RIDPI|nr:hypothetical protein NP493_109g07042 [Ridgeia piscesae]
MATMSDSIRVVEEDSVQRIHSNKLHGKLHKGLHPAPPTASIPSKYHTIVVSHAEKKGFLSNVKRFDSLIMNDNPGPVTYDIDSAPEKCCAVVSRKGMGGLAVKDRRIARPPASTGPGAAAYGLPSMLQSRQDFNRAQASGPFHLPIAKKLERRGFPAPNEYDVLKHKNKYRNLITDAAFRSRTKRAVNFKNADEADKPAPCQYNIKEKLVKDSVKVPYSSFKSTVARKMLRDPPDFPGPGTYAPHEAVQPVDKMGFSKKHYLCISAPAMPLPETPPLPGPGAYDVVNYEGPPKHFMSSSQFVSATTRWQPLEGATGVSMPGPGK